MGEVLVPSKLRGGRLAEFLAELFPGTELISLVVTEDLWTEIAGD